MKNRQLIYVPEINDRTFLLFFFRGSSGRSYSFRSYSLVTGMRLMRASQFDYDVDEILDMAKHSFDAPTHDTNDVDFWSGEIDRLNARFLGQSEEASDHLAKTGVVSGALQVPPAPPSMAPPQTSRRGDEGQRSRFPILMQQQLIDHPTKGHKPQDMERILTSARSEDYVTWTVFSALQALPSQLWWPWLVDLANDACGGGELATLATDVPEVSLWRKFPAPQAYERASRRRMAESDTAEWVARAAVAAPVEGESEIDIVLEGETHLVFVEAKLDSDVSASTTYDPSRNQIVRNIDVLLDRADGRRSFFWMVVKDTGPSRQYTQTMEKYRSDVSSLATLLPHRHLEELDQVAQALALLRWSDVLGVAERGYHACWEEVRKRL